MFKLKLDGTTKNILTIGKAILDFSTLTASRLFKFPDADGSNNQILKSNGDGSLSWTTVDALNTDKGSTAVSTHVALSDPHTQYVKKAGDSMAGTLTLGSGSRLAVDVTGLWASFKSSVVSTSYMYFFKGNTSTVIGYIGSDGGAIKSGGDGSNFGIRAENDLILMAGGGDRAKVASNGQFVVNAATSGSTSVAYVGGNSGGFESIGLTSGVTVLNHIHHTQNTTGSNAALVIGTAGTSGGSPYVRFDITSGQTWALGSDNADSDKFKIGRGLTPDTSTIVTLDSALMKVTGTLEASVGVKATGASVGEVGIFPGDSSLTGYVNFKSPSGSQEGYIGNSDSNAGSYNGIIKYVTGFHDFYGIQRVKLKYTGSFSSSGGTVVDLTTIMAAGSMAVVKVLGAENGYVNHSGSIWMILRYASGFDITKISEIAVGNTNGQAVLSISGNNLRIANAAGSSLGTYALNFSMTLY